MIGYCEQNISLIKNFIYFSSQSYNLSMLLYCGSEQSSKTTDLFCRY